MRGDLKRVTGSAAIAIYLTEPGIDPGQINRQTEC